MDGELEGGAGMLRTEADFVGQPGAAKGLGVAVLATVGDGDKLQRLVADTEESLHDLHDGGGVFPLGFALAEADSDGKDPRLVPEVERLVPSR